ncbi:hypothetical protein OC845_002551 [Tilletia horrida]|nr:hypothetical protein OC845_002551 [Tilletia horrida]
MATPLLSPVPAYGFALNGFGHYADEEAKRGSDQALPPFELAPILEPALPASSTANVRCTEAYESHLYVGNSEGHVLWYTLANEGTSTQTTPYQLNTSIPIGSGSKPVEKVILLPAVSVAAVLCESVVSFFELPSFQPILPSVLPNIKAVATIVSDDAETPFKRSSDGLAGLCIIKRKQIILARISRERWLQVKEIPLPGGASIARRYRDQLCIATTSAYSLVNLADATVLPLGLPISQTTDSPSASVRPSILSIIDGSHAKSRHNDRENGPKECEFLITSHSESQTLGVFVRSNGEPAPKLIEWPSHPRALVLDGSHVFALLRNDSIEIHSLNTMDKLSTMNLSSALEPRFLTSPPAASFTDSPRAWLCCKNAIHQVTETPLMKRARWLFDREKWEELRRVADTAWDNGNRTRYDFEIHSKEVEAERKAYIKDLQEINQEIGLHFMEAANFALARRYLSRGRLDPRVLIGTFEDIRRDVLDDEDGENAGQVRGGLLETARSWRSIEDIIRANLEHNYGTIDYETTPIMKRLADRLLERAKHDLLRGFLVDCRQRRKAEQREGRLGMDELTWRRTGMIIDVVLAKVYAALGDLDELLAIMNEPGNESLVAEVERALRSAGQYGMLAGLLLKKGDQGGAMETVTDPAVREQISVLLDAQSVQLDLMSTLQDLSEEWKLNSSGLQVFLRRHLTEQFHRRKEAQIVKALSLAQNLEVAETVWGAMSKGGSSSSNGGGRRVVGSIPNGNGSAAVDAGSIRTSKPEKDQQSQTGRIRHEKSASAFAPRTAPFADSPANHGLAALQ